MEIHHKLEETKETPDKQLKNTRELYCRHRGHCRYRHCLFIDQTITAVGMARQVWATAVVAMIVAVAVMLLAAGAIGNFVARTRR